MPNKQAKILIVDDERQIRTLLRGTLDRAGYRVIEAANAQEAINSKSIDHPDVILLDLGLPDGDGLELVTAFRRNGGGRIIVLSAREETEQKVAALDLGADDYVTKPFDTEELLARIRTVLRQQLASEADHQVVKVGGVTIDLFARTVKREDGEVHLTPKEWAVLSELAKRPGRVRTHSQILRTVWGPAQEQQTEYLRVIVRALRQKLEDRPAEPRLIINEPAVGYRLVG